MLRHFDVGLETSADMVGEELGRSASTNKLIDTKLSKHFGALDFTEKDLKHCSTKLSITFL